MKKIITILLAISVVAVLAACGDKTNKENNDVAENNIVETNKTEENIDVDNEAGEEKKEDKTEEKTDKEPEKKPENTQTTKPTEKPQTQKPAEKPVEKPAEKPVEKPVEKPAVDNSTLGKTLLSEFKAKAASGMSAQAIADALLANPAIKFSGVTAPVEEGYLAGFSNAEIKGFKSGITFAPMIGSIPFVGYVFELDNAADAASFISKLEKNANLRWNVCVEADEMITGSSGNKVFFVMCPTKLED